MKKFSIKELNKLIESVIDEHEVDAGTHQTFLMQTESVQKYITQIAEMWVQYEQKDDIKLLEKAYGNALATQSTIEDILNTLEEVKKEHHRISGR